MYKKLLLLLVLLAPTAQAKLVIEIQHASPSNLGSLGTITAIDTEYGLLLTPDLMGLPKGLHGFHVHAVGSCEQLAMAAGGHFDPTKTTKHLGPYNSKGHLGDLPALFVDQECHANTPVLAPRLKEKDLIGHSLMIHAGGDNFSDAPAKLGGGGKRLACGVIK